MQSAVIETLLGRSVHLVFTIFTIIFLTSAVIHTLGQYDRVAFEDASNELSQRFWFHDAVYFVVVTITTIGYGDSRSHAEGEWSCHLRQLMATSRAPDWAWWHARRPEHRSRMYTRSFGESWLRFLDGGELHRSHAVCCPTHHQHAPGIWLRERRYMGGTGTAT